MHPIVRDDPGYRRCVTEPAERLARAKQASLARAQQARDRYERERQAHAQARRQALLTGQTPPDPPAKPRAVHDEQLFMSETERLRAEERRWLADNAQRIESAAAEREAALLAQARDLVAQLDALTPELNLLAATLRELRRATGDGQRPAPGTVDVPALVQAVRAGRRVIDAPTDQPRPYATLTRTQVIP